MQDAQTTADVTCALHQFERNRYFYGKLMTVRDFETEQRYGQGHRYLHNQALHGWGVVCGLRVEPKGGPGNEQKLVVHPGVALDCCGHEIVVARDQEVDLREFQAAIGPVEATGKTVYLCVKYAECTREPVPALANVSTCEEVCDYNRMQEHGAFEILDALPEAEATDVCEIWMNMTTVRSNIEDDTVVIAEFERTAPRSVRQGDVFEVRRSIKPTASGQTIALMDSLPDGFSLLDGSLVMEATDTIEGKVVHSSYIVKLDSVVTPATHQITGETLQSPPADLPASEIEVITSTRSLEQHLQEALFAQAFAACPHCAEDPTSRCVILARITLQQQDASFVVDSIDDITFDTAQGIYRRLVYPMPLIAELLTCLKNAPRPSGTRTAGQEVQKVATGLVIFENVRPGEERTSPPIAHQLGVNYVAIVMALENIPDIDDPLFTVVMGDQSAGNEPDDPFIPLLIAHYDPNDPQRQFHITLVDQRGDEQEGPENTLSVRWWAIPKTLDQPDVRVPPVSPDDRRPLPRGLQQLLRRRQSRAERERPSARRSRYHA
jgi:hypothetical protein